MENLTKSEKKLARQIIDKGFKAEYEAGLKKSANILEQWIQDKLNIKDAYMKLYKNVVQHDKHIGRRYNNITGSMYLYIISGQLADDIIAEQDLSDFCEQTKQKIYLLSGLNDEL